jgi:hypothetical protein
MENLRDVVLKSINCGDLLSLKKIIQENLHIINEVRVVLLIYFYHCLYNTIHTVLFRRWVMKIPKAQYSISLAGKNDPRWSNFCYLWMELTWTGIPLR